MTDSNYIKARRELKKISTKLDDSSNFDKAMGELKSISTKIDKINSNLLGLNSGIEKTRNVFLLCWVIGLVLIVGVCSILL